MAAPQPPSQASASRAPTGRSVLAWSAGRRLVAVLPALGLLWLAVWWANLDAAPL